MHSSHRVSSRSYRVAAMHRTSEAEHTTRHDTTLTDTAGTRWDMSGRTINAREGSRVELSGDWSVSLVESAAARIAFNTRQSHYA